MRIAKKINRLTPREQKLVRGVLEKKSITDAALAAGYGKGVRRSAARTGSQALRRIRREMPEIMNAVGLDQETVMRDVLKPLMYAKEKKYFEHRGKVTDEREVINYEARAKGLDIWAKLNGSYPNTKDISGNINNYTFIGNGNLPRINAVIDRRPVLKESTPDGSVESSTGS